MWLAFVALIALRLMVGFHFYREGTSKLDPRSTFSAEYFLAGAKGPLAPFFHSFLDDPDGSKRLCVTKKMAEKEIMPTSLKEAIGEEAGMSSSSFMKKETIEIDPEISLLVMADQLEQAGSHYMYGDPDLIAELVQRREDLAQQIRDARADQDRSVNTRELERLRAKDLASIEALRTQVERADEILASHQEQLTSWLNGNRTEILAHYGQSHRLDGFERDGDNRKKVATYVESLNGQLGTITDDRNKQLNGWKYEVGAIWDSYEDQLRTLAVDKQARKPDFELHRPFDQKNSKLKTIDRIIPWFDTIVGVLLILGFFTRVASLAGAGFLASVIATQPPWIPGTTDTIYQSVELFALLVLFATCAGRFGGLDFFFSPKTNQQFLSSESAS